MRSRGAKVRIFIGTLLVCAAVFLVVYNMRESNKAGEESARVVNDFYEALRQKAEEAAESDALPVWDPLVPEEIEREMPVEEIDGYRYIGVLEFPGLNLSLPVMEEWDLTRLRISPCRYSGSYYKDDLVICGHNYATHFSPLNWIDISEEVIFRAADGKEYDYIVTNRENLRPQEVEEMIDSEADWDLTLFTCTASGQTRCAVRCERKTEENSQSKTTKTR